MRLKTLLALATFATVGQLLPQDPSGGDPFLGTWLLDVDKSSFGVSPRLKSLTVEWRREGAGYRVASEGERRDGQPVRDTYMAIYDGKERPNPGGPWEFDTVANRVLDRFTREDSFTKGGKPYGVIRREIAADGKQMKVVSTFYARGGEDRWVLILVRK